MNVTMDWKQWKTELFETYGINYLYKQEDIKDLLFKPNVIFCTRCSGTKGIVKEDQMYTAKELYKNNVNIMFYQVMESLKLRYGTLSDKHALLLDTEKVYPYNLHPSSLDDEAFKKLGEQIRTTAETNKWDTIVFYNLSPKMSKPYFRMLQYSGLKVYFMNHIELVKKAPLKGLF